MGITLSFIFGHSLFLCCVSLLGVFSSSSWTLVHFPSTGLNSSACWVSTTVCPGRCKLVAVESSVPTFPSSKSSGPTLNPAPVRAASTSWAFTPLGAEPACPLRPTSFPSHAVIFNPVWCLDSLHPVASCFCQQKQAVKLQS